MRHANRLLEQTTRTLAERGESYGSPQPLFENVAKYAAILNEIINNNGGAYGA